MIVVAILSSLLAQDAPVPPAPPEPAPRVGCTVALSLDYDFEERWAHVPTDSAPRPTRAATVVRKQSFTVFTFLTGCASGAKGEMDVEGDVRITKPDGTTWYEQKGAAFLRGRALVASAEMLSHVNVSARFEAGDTFGEYTATVTVRDKLGKTTATASEALRLAPFPNDVKFDGKEDAIDWLQSYVRAPRPNEAVEAFLTFSRTGALQAGPMATRAWGFFAEVFGHNTYLFPVLLGRYAKLEKGEKESILRLLVRTGYDAGDFVEKLPPGERELTRVYAMDPKHDSPADPISDPVLIETLWGTFLANGAYTPIVRLCRALGVPSEDDNVRVDREPAQRAARFMLSADVPAHALARGYCRWILENEELLDPAPTVLGEILEKR